jgi:hypothetical protein
MKLTKQSSGYITFGIGVWFTDPGPALFFIGFKMQKKFPKFFACYMPYKQHPSLKITCYLLRSYNTVETIVFLIFCLLLEGS